MGILCLRLAEKLPQAPTGAKSREVILRDKWLLLHRAASLIDAAAHPAHAATALEEMGLLLLQPGAEALAREFLAEDDAGGAAGGGGAGGEGAERRLRLPSPLRERGGGGDAAPGHSGEQQGGPTGAHGFPPLVFTGSVFATAGEGAPTRPAAQRPRPDRPAAAAAAAAPAAAPVSEQLWAAWRLLRRARRVLSGGRLGDGDAASAPSAPTLRERAARIACQEGGCCFDLARRRYNSGSLGEALALAQVNRQRIVCSFATASFLSTVEHCQAH